MFHVSGVMCQVSHDVCVSSVTCHLSLDTNSTATARHPPPASFPIMHNRLVCKDLKTQNVSKCKKNH